MSKELAKTYDPKGLEDRLYQKWLDSGYFHAKVNKAKKPFTIVMPPPNVTGQLHMGHALDETMQDILIRFKRMQGYEALWQPGTDHAAIASYNGCSPTPFGHQRFGCSITRASGESFAMISVPSGAFTVTS